MIWADTRSRCIALIRDPPGAGFTVLLRFSQEIMTNAGVFRDKEGCSETTCCQKA